MSHGIYRLLHEGNDGDLSTSQGLTEDASAVQEGFAGDMNENVKSTTTSCSINFFFQSYNLR